VSVRQWHVWLMLDPLFRPRAAGSRSRGKSVLLDLAAEQLKARKENLSVENGVVFVSADKNPG